MERDENNEFVRTGLEFTLIGAGLIAAGAVLLLIASATEGLDPIAIMLILERWLVPHIAFTVLSLWPGGRLLCAVFMVGQFMMVPLSVMANVEVTSATDPLSGIAFYAFVFNWAIAAVFIGVGVISRAVIRHEAELARDEAAVELGTS